ncbi:MAG: hypothetical protein ACIALR_06840 [Blastopirellula sp. JB062]
MTPALVISASARDDRIYSGGPSSVALAGFAGGSDIKPISPPNWGASPRFDLS